MEVDSRLGEGSTFRVSVPCGREHLAGMNILPDSPAPADVAAFGALLEEPEHWFPAVRSPSITRVLPEEIPLVPTFEASEADPRGRPKVLVVDDHQEMRSYLRRLMSAHYEVETASDGEEALAQIRRSLPDLIVCDLVMPSSHGFDLLAGVRRHPTTSSIPVIIISARASQGARIEGLDRGADDYVFKPFSPRELLAKVQSQLKLTLVRDLANREKAKVYAAIQDAPVAIAYLDGKEHTIIFANDEYNALVLDPETKDAKETNETKGVSRQEAVSKKESAETTRSTSRTASISRGGSDNIVGRVFTEVLPAFDRAMLEEGLEASYRSGQAWSRREVPLEDEDLSSSHRSRKPSAQEQRFFNVSLHPVIGSTGASEAILFFAFEVTDLVRAKVQMEELAGEAEVEARRKDQFLAMLGHELRNPLTPIVGAVELLRGLSRQCPPEVGWTTEVIGRQALHLTRMVDDLLDVARLTSGRINLHKEFVSVDDVVATALDAAKPLVEERGQRLSVSGPDEAITVYGDRTRLAQALTNLLDNATKYTEAGGRIWLRIERSSGEVTFEVRDTGTGIPTDFLPRIFDLFVQADRTLDRSAGGLGLGLTLVKQLVEMHGGHVAAASDGIGQGSTFRFSIPLARRQPSRPGRAPAPAPTVERSILIVDDNRDLAETLALLLRRRGHTVSIDGDGTSAIERLHQGSDIEVALIDIGLPGMNGYEVARALRAQAETKALTLIAISGYGQAQDRRNAFDAGFDHHVLKPVRIEQLEALLAPRA